MGYGLDYYPLPPFIRRVKVYEGIDPERSCAKQANAPGDQSLTCGSAGGFTGARFGGSGECSRVRRLNTGEGRYCYWKRFTLDKSLCRLMGSSRFLFSCSEHKFI